MPKQIATPKKKKPAVIQITESGYSKPKGNKK